jgi:hypothetical protein
MHRPKYVIVSHGDKSMYEQLPRDSEKLLRLCRDQGWEIGYTTGGSLRLRSPHGKIVFWGKNVGDVRAVRNFRANLSRAGLKAEPTSRRSERPAPPLMTSLAQLTQPEPSSPPPESTEMIAKHDASHAGNGAQPTGRAKTQRTILEAIQRIDSGRGVEAQDIFSRVAARHPRMELKALGTSLANNERSGWLTRQSRGRYSLSEAGKKLLEGGMPESKLQRRALLNQTDASTPPPHAAQEPPQVLSMMPLPSVPTGEDMNDDIRILDNALEALAQLETVIRQHRQIANQFAQLKQVLSVLRTP